MVPVLFNSDVVDGADPAGGRQTTTYAICNMANKGKSFRSLLTGSATKDGKRILYSATSIVGCANEYIRAVLEELLMLTGGTGGFGAGAWVEECCVPCPGREGDAGADAMVLVPFFFFFFGFVQAELE